MQEDEMAGKEYKHGCDGYSIGNENCDNCSFSFISINSKSTL